MERNIHGYTPERNAPADRPNVINFELSGTGAASVMASPVLMNYLSARIIENCSTIGIVLFYESGSINAYQQYGYMPGQMVRPFQCW